MLSVHIIGIDRSLQMIEYLHTKKAEQEEERQGRQQRMYLVINLATCL